MTKLQDVSLTDVARAAGLSNGGASYALRGHPSIPPSTVERVRRIHGDVQCSTLVSYRAGKPFAVDRFNVEQRILAGALPEDVVAARVASGSLTIVEDPHTQRSP